MTNEMKLLRAFIKAQGYEIEEIEVVDTERLDNAEIGYAKYVSEGGSGVGKPSRYDFTSIDYKVTQKITKVTHEQTTQPWLNDRSHLGVIF